MECRTDGGSGVGSIGRLSALLPYLKMASPEPHKSQSADPAHKLVIARHMATLIGLCINFAEVFKSDRSEKVGVDTSIYTYSTWATKVKMMMGYKWNRRCHV